jgi:hypothetical protein
MLIVIPVFDDEGSFEGSLDFGTITWDTKKTNSPRFVNINEAMERAIGYTKRRCALLNEIKDGKNLHYLFRLGILYTVFHYSVCF